MGFGDNQVKAKHHEVIECYQCLGDDVYEWELSNQVKTYTMNVTILTLNCNGLRNKLKRKAVFSFLKKQKINIACVQETYITTEDIDMWKREWGGEVFYTPGSHYSKGLITLIDKKFEVQTVSYKSVSDRILCISLSYLEKCISILNVYAPNIDKEKSEFLHDLESYIQQLPVSHGVVVAGDFDMVLNNDLDVISGKPHDEKTTSRFNEFLLNSDLYDIWRIHNDREFTWSSSYTPWKARRLDYLIVNDAMCDKTVCCDIIPVANTDHRAVFMTVAIGLIKRGPGYWKFNQSLLKDKEYVKLITNKIQWCKTTLESLTPQMKWDYCKSQIKECSIRFSKTKALQRKNAMADIRDKSRHLQSAIANYDPDNSLVPQEELVNEMKDTKLALDIYALYDAQGAQTRARIKWLENGERNNKYFLQLEKCNFNKKIMTSLKDKHGQLHTTQKRLWKYR